MSGVVGLCLSDNNFHGLITSGWVQKINLVGVKKINNNFIKEKYYNFYKIHNILTKEKIMNTSPFTNCNYLIEDNHFYSTVIIIFTFSPRSKTTKIINKIKIKLHNWIQQLAKGSEVELEIMQFLRDRRSWGRDHVLLVED